MSKKHYIIPIFVPHEGCVHNCVFCNQNSITGISEVIDAKYTKNTIKAYLETINRTEETVIEVSFFGGSFTAIDINKQRRLLKVAREYKEKGLIDFIRLSTRPDYIDDFILTNLKEYKVDIIELGVQSLDEEVLKRSARGHSEEHVRKASKLIHEYGFTLGHQVMLGLPGDTFEKDIKTALKVVEMKPKICRIYPALVIKNTPMEKMYEQGIYKPYTLEEAVEISKELYNIFTKNNIEVIRIGLQPTEEINEGGELVAGPFHPAFRELVESKIINERILDYLKDKDYKKIEIEISPKNISKLYSNKKQLFNDTLNKLKLNNIKVIQNSSLGEKSIGIKYDEIYNVLPIHKKC
ncbi:elongator complex protein 3 [Clostridium cochlearium]|uniref:Oxygen-independent coproporphyrinogen III oxidase n=1 Tax=Clostridium cochlearium TaxID=1494 RepID=A0A239ZXU6_CLOCO|nr:radical SAM protein [Clostridium cochlearium]MBV1819657.1 radical SAM protein [Bacteroidales bacterium MSK.15.36]NSJ90049.1 radical SAM protein [Coprococcus sp. MSK.21.13]MBU5268738.1 radical SAM protein [Clostridium cochlearium]MCG4572743.1 radical SAM protein [Clostridium cochlearium]MCG4578970.1 radical SAM protein [Clostridium cochlearium]